MSNPRIPRQIPSFLLTLALLVTLIPQPVRAVSQSEIDALEDKKALLAQQAQEQQAAIDELNESKALFIERKAALDTKIELNKEEIRLITEQIELYDQLIEKKENELAQALEAEETQSTKLRARMRALEESGTLSYVSVLLEATSLTDLLSRLADITDIMRYDKKLETSYINTREDVEVIMTEYEDVQRGQEEIRSELDRKTAQLSAQVKAAYTMIANLDELSEDARAEYAAIAADEERIAAEIQELMNELALQEAAERIAALQQAAANNANNSANSGAGSSNTNTGSDTSSGDEAAGDTPSADAPGGDTAAGDKPSGGTSDRDTPSDDVSTDTGAEDSSASGAVSFLWPTPSCYLITSRYGYRESPTAGATSNHLAIDIGAAEGAAILASASGTVEIAWYNGGYGNNVFINHGSGIGTNYAHMSSIAVSAGDYVTQGQVIGYVGSTGVATGPHLHYEIWINGARVDPTGYFSGYTFWNC